MSILQQKGIVVQGQQTYSKFNIFDFSGKVMKDLIVFLGRFENEQMTYDQILQQIIRSIRTVMKKNTCPDAVWYIVFDPIIRDENSIVSKLKEGAWKKRSQNQANIHNLTTGDIVNFIQYFYYPLKNISDIFDKNVTFVMSQHESDIMCGSIKQQLRDMYCDELPNSQITIYSTDSDLLIHSFPFNYYSLSHECLIKSNLFFQLFNEPHPNYLPAMHGCDYVDFTQRFPSKSSYFKEHYMNLSERDLLIAAVFSKQNLLENMFMEYEIDWKQKIDEYINKCNSPKLKAME